MNTTAQSSYSRAPGQSTAANVIAWNAIFGIVLGCVGFAAFILVLEWVTHGAHGVVRFDRGILMWMDRHHEPVLTTIAKGLAWMGSPAVIVTVAAVATVVGMAVPRTRGAAWTFPVAAGGAGLIIQGVKLAVHRTRPDLFQPLIHEQGYSFPSGHSMIAVVIYGLIGYFALGFAKSKAARAAVIAATTIIVVAISVSRVYVGVHYPTDVLAGWSAGVPWLIICIGLHEVMARRWDTTGKSVLNRPPAISRSIDTVFADSPHRRQSVH